MAFGIFSTISYCIFILWMYLTRPQASQTNHIPLWTMNVGPIAGTINEAVTITTVFVSILK
jgi:hypothetical protein